MPSGWSVTTKGEHQIEAELSKLGDMSMLDAPMRAALKVLQQEASRFPPQPSRTRAKTFNNWIRERGAYSRATFFGASGKQRSKPRTGAGVLLRPSEMLLAKWRDAQPQIIRSANMITGRITNAASYGPYVQGDKQAKFHALTPWLTIEQIYKKCAARIEKVFGDALTRGT